MKVYNLVETSLSAALRETSLTISDKLKMETFKDGEHLPLFQESIRGEDAFIICSDKSSDSIMKVLLSVDAAKRSGCTNITLVYPFLPYTRQDKAELRSSIGSKLMADILQVAGVTKLISVDLHASVQCCYNIEVVHINGGKIFKPYIERLKLDDMVIVSPDQGGVKRATSFAKLFPNSSFAMINKERNKPNEIHRMELVGDVKGKNAVIIDDLVDTASTLCKAAELILEHGAKSVRAICTHAVMSDKAYDNINNSVLKELIVSDTLELKESSPKIKVVSCANMLSKVMIKVSNRESINEVN